MVQNVALPNPNSDARGNVQGWTQVDKRTCVEISKLAIQQPSAIAVLFFLMSRTNRGSNAVLMSHAAIAQCMDIAERTVRNAIDTLKEAKFIRISKSGKSNVYELNSRTSWQGKRGARHASFSAEVTVIEKEQNTSVDDLIREAEDFRELPFMDDDESGAFSPTK